MPHPRRVLRVLRVLRVPRVRSPSHGPRGAVAMHRMRFLGYSGREFLRIGFAAAVFFLVVKWLAPKTGVAALNQAAEKL